MSGVLKRLSELEEAFSALQQAGPFTRWWFFLLKADPLIAKETFRNFRPGLPMTTEGLIYGLAGLLLAWGLYRGLRVLIFYGGRKIGTLLKPTAPAKPGRPTKPGLPL